MANYRFNELKKSVDYFMGATEYHMHISTSNSKLGCIPSFNLMPGVTCSRESCAHCLREGCYAVKNAFRAGYNVEKNAVLRSWSENTAYSFSDLDGLKNDLAVYLQSIRHTCKLFRIHSSGDFFSTEYAMMWYDLAMTFPEIRFLAFTKQWDIARSVPFYNLKNFSLVLSGWTGIAIPEDLRDHYRCAWCNDGQEMRIPSDAMVCPGSCESCGMCWYLSELGRDTQFNKH